MKKMLLWLNTLRLRWHLGWSGAQTVSIPKWMREREKAHGVHLVEGPVARAVFIDVARADLEAAGFELEQDRRFARTVSADIVHLLELQPFKGKQYGFRWGVSLSFVPHAWKRRPQWHRTLRGARMDLFQMLADALSEHDFYPAQRRGEIDGLHGETVFREDLVDAWTEQREKIFNWFDTATDIEGVAAEAEQQAAQVTGGISHWPPPRLVQAFCHARLGRLVEAEAALEDALDGDRASLEPVESLLAAFRAVVKKRIG